MLRGENAIVPTPRIILLDINMPKMNGIEFLKKLRADPDLKSICVFVLSTSDQDRDIVHAHEYNVAGYIVKPVDVEKLHEAVGSLKNIWNHSQFPHQ